MSGGLVCRSIASYWVSRMSVLRGKKCSFVTGEALASPRVNLSTAAHETETNASFQTATAAAVFTSNLAL